MILGQMSSSMSSGSVNREGSWSDGNLSLYKSSEFCEINIDIKLPLVNSAKLLPFIGILNVHF